MTKPIKSARHHWWPRSLSQFWADTDGCTSQLSWEGTLTRLPPSQFGAITNAHHIKLGQMPTIWDESFESDFNVADSNFPTLIQQVLQLDAGPAGVGSCFEGRLIGQRVPPEMLRALTECIVSLIVRGPRFRHSMKIMVESYRQDFGIKDYEAEDKLIGANMRGCQRAFTTAISNHGKFALLYSDSREFIFGDGFLHNFTYPRHAPLVPVCLVPLLPTVAIVYSKPMQYCMHPKLVTMRLKEEEVEFINQIVQVYSRDFVYFRSDRPTPHPAFARHEFLIFEYHKHPWLDQLTYAMAETRPGVTPYAT